MRCGVLKLHASKVEKGLKHEVRGRRPHRRTWHIEGSVTEQWQTTPWDFLEKDLDRRPRKASADVSPALQASWSPTIQNDCLFSARRREPEG